MLKRYSMVISFLIILSACGLTPMSEKPADDYLLIIDEVYWGYPDDFLSVKVFPNRITYDYARYFAGHLTMAPVVYRNEICECKNIDHYDNPKVVPTNIALESVLYEKHTRCTHRVIPTSPSLIRVYVPTTKKVFYLLDPLGNQVHHCIMPKESGLTNCNKGIPASWNNIVELICLVRNSIRQKPEMKWKDGKEPDNQMMFNKMCREYYGPGGPGESNREYPKGLTIIGPIDSVFLSHLYKDKKITDVPFDDIAEILTRRRNIIKETTTLIKWDEYNSLLESSNYTFSEFMRDQYGGSFKELEILVGLADEKSCDRERKP